jgi:SAM-dependent methyltransferase
MTFIKKNSNSLTFNHKTIDKRNKQIYLNKDLIELIYSNYYKIIKKNLLTNEKFACLEIGSGNGNIKKIIPNCITSEQFKKKKIDRIENIYKIKYNKNSISNIILIDVFHHLKFPNSALKNMHRVLIKNGRIIMIEPAMGLIPRIIYKIFHYEPNGFNLKIDWDNIPKKIPSSNQYFAAQSMTWRAFFLKELNLKSKYKIKFIKPFSDFAYLLSGGYSYKAFYPKILYSFIKLIDKMLTSISIKIFSARMLVVLEKK